MLERSTDQLEKLNASDKEGVLLFSPSSRRSEAGSELQVWRSLRPTEGPIRVSYVVPAALMKTPKRGPHVDLQAVDGGLSGAFMGFYAYRM